MRDTAGRAIAQATIRAVWVAGDDAPAELARAAGSARGLYSLPVALPFEQGVLLLAADAPGFGTAQRLVEPSVARQDFVLVRGSTTATVRVLDEEGKAVGGAEVVVSLDPLAGEPQAVIVFSGASDAGGTFVARTVPVTAGTVHWSAVSPGKGRAVGEVAKKAGAAPIQIVARLDPGSALEGAVVDAAGQPVAGAPVRASEVQGPWVETATSDGEGKFRIAGAPHTAGLGVGVGGDWILADGQDVVPVETPEEGSPAPLRLVVEPAGTIDGWVEAASGRVAGATVEALPTDRTMGGPRQVVSGADGTFHIEGLRLNTTWDLEARHARHAPAVEEGVAARSGGVVVRMRTGGGIAGRVTDRAGRGYPEVEAYAHRIAREESTTVGLREYASVKSGADGRFLIEHLNPGNYRVEVRSPARLAFSPTAATVHEVVVEDGEVTAVEDTQLERGGRLRIATVAPTVPPWLTVSILPAGKGGAPHQAQLWGKHGVFEMDVVEPGLFDVAGQNGEIGQVRVEGVRIEPGETTEVTLAFPASRVLAGKVVDADERPVVAATVDAFLDNAGSQSDYSLPGRAPDNFSGNVTHTGEDGSFRLGGVDSGRYRLRISKSGLPPIERTVNVTAGGEPIAIRLPRGATLQVALVGREGADKVVLVETFDGGGHRASAITDGRGAVRFAALPPGRYRVGAIVEGMNEDEVRLADGDSKRLVLESNRR